MPSFHICRIDTNFQLTYLAHLHLTNFQRISSRFKFIIVWLMMQKRDSDWIKGKKHTTRTINFWSDQRETILMCTFILCLWVENNNNNNDNWRPCERNMSIPRFLHNGHVPLIRHNRFISSRSSRINDITNTDSPQYWYMTKL